MKEVSCGNMCALENSSSVLCWNRDLDSVVEKKSWKPLVWCTEAMKQNSDACLTKGATVRGGRCNVSVPSRLSSILFFFFGSGAGGVGTIP